MVLSSHFNDCFTWLADPEHLTTTHVGEVSIHTHVPLSPLSITIKVYGVTFVSHYEYTEHCLKALHRVFQCSNCLVRRFLAVFLHFQTTQATRENKDPKQGLW